MKLQKGERVITAYAEHANGLGWHNSPVWVIILGSTGQLRQACIQPEEQTAGMRRLYDVCDAAHRSLTAEVQKLLSETATGREHDPQAD